MRVNDNPETIPAIGTQFDWDISEIMERHSGDTLWYIDEYLSENYDYENETECDEAPTVSEMWDYVLEKKREDDHYDDVVESIQTHGFVRPLTANINTDDDGNLFLKFGDGHHRLAAALELGMTTIPVVVCSRFTVSKDSGSWNRDMEIPTVITVR